MVVFAEVESNYDIDDTLGAFVADRVLRRSIAGEPMAQLPHTLSLGRPDGMR